MVIDQRAPFPRRDNSRLSGTEQAIFEIGDMKAQALQEATTELSRQYLSIGQLPRENDRQKEAVHIGHELLEIADRDGDLSLAIHAFGMMCPVYGCESRAISNCMKGPFVINTPD